MSDVPFCLSVYLSVCISDCLSICLSICQLIYFSARLFVSICLSLLLCCLPVCISVCFCIYLFFYLLLPVGDLSSSQSAHLHCPLPTFTALCPPTLPSAGEATDADLAVGNPDTPVKKTITKDNFQFPEAPKYATGVYFGATALIFAVFLTALLDHSAGGVGSRIVSLSFLQGHLTVLQSLHLLPSSLAHYRTRLLTVTLTH